MEVVVLGAGIIGTSAAWHLARRGHDVTVVIERQNGAALETSFANAAQISVSYCEPWANRDAPLKALKWTFSSNAPLMFRLQFCSLDIVCSLQKLFAGFATGDDGFQENF